MAEPEPGSSFEPIDPFRAYDSRSPGAAAGGPLASGASRLISVADSLDPASGRVRTPDLVPAGATAVAYNITAVDTVGSGFLSVAPGSVPVIGASSINWTQSSQVLANGLAVGLDANRQVRVFAGGAGGAGFVIDITGFYVPTKANPTGGLLEGTEPYRAYDSRAANPAGVIDGPLASGQSRTIGLNRDPGADRGLPARALGVAYNITVTDTVGTGYLSVTRASEPASTSSINWGGPADTIANALTVGLAPGGRGEINVTAGGGGAANLVIDVVGYFVPGDAAPDGGQFFPMAPTRTFDSRLPASSATPFADGKGRFVPVNASRDAATGAVAVADEVPASAVAVAYNATAIGESNAGWLAVTPNDSGSGSTSTLNWSAAGQIRANGSIVGLDQGRREVYVAGGMAARAHVVLDVAGYYAPAHVGARVIRVSGPCVLTSDQRTLCRQLAPAGSPPGTEPTWQPGQVDWSAPPAPGPVAGVPGTPTQVASGPGHACAVVAGEVWCWGDNQAGQLGRGTISGGEPCTVEGPTCRGGLTIEPPAKVAGLTDVVKVQVSGSGYTSTTCALTSSGHLFCWGVYFYSMRSPAAWLQSSTPLDMARLSPLLTGGLTDVAVSGQQIYAVNQANELLGWGNNWNHEIGIPQKYNDVYAMGPIKMVVGP